MIPALINEHSTNNQDLYILFFVINYVMAITNTINGENPAVSMTLLTSVQPSVSLLDGGNLARKRKKTIIGPGKGVLALSSRLNNT